MATIKLGNRDSGELEIKAISHQWEEHPQLKSDKLRTDKKLYLELDKENYNLLAEYYRNMVIGDNAEGLASKISTYYELFAVKSDSRMMSKCDFLKSYPDFDEYIDDNVDDTYSYIVVVF